MPKDPTGHRTGVPPPGRSEGSSAGEAPYPTLSQFGQEPKSEGLSRLSCRLSGMLGDNTPVKGGRPNYLLVLRKNKITVAMYLLAYGTVLTLRSFASSSFVLCTY